MAHDSPLPHYLVRAGMALGSSFGSEHASLLSQDGYDLSSRTMFVTDVSFMPWPQVGLGVFLASAYDGADPGNGAPVLDRTETYYLAQVTGQTVSGVLGLTLSLRAGLADSTLELKDAGKTKSSFAAGVEVAAIVLPAHLGLGFGLLWAPPYTPSDLGRPYQVGGYYFAISGVFHD